MGLILDDAAVGFRMGGEWDGTAPVFTGATTDYMGQITTGEVTDQLEKTEVRGAGMRRKRHRFHGAGAVAMLQGVVLANGYAFKEMAGPSPVGRCFEMTVFPKTTTAVPDVHVGVITKWRWSSSKGEPQVEEMEIDLDADFEDTV